VLENRIYIYKFTDLQLIEAIDTCANPLGLCSVSYDEQRCILACPDKSKGKVKIINFET
jgi:WD repeat-containing protein 45